MVVDAELGIRSAGLSDRDLDAFSLFVEEHVAESGQEGGVHFAFSRKVARDDVRSNALTRWSRSLDEPSWGRAWLLWTPDEKRVVGHVELKGGRLEAELHRATLGMGILRPHTGKGYGKKLIEVAIAWAKRQRRLSWIDLGVFSHNKVARRLYERTGFVEIGERKDAFRIDGAGRVDDVQMALALPRESK